MIWLLLLSPKSWGSGLLPQFCDPLTGWEGVVQAACNSLKFWAPWRLCNSSCPCLQTPRPLCVCVFYSVPSDHRADCSPNRALGGFGDGASLFLLLYIPN